MMAKFNDLSPKEFRRLDVLIDVDAGKVGKGKHIGQMKSIACLLDLSRRPKVLLASDSKVYCA